MELVEKPLVSVVIPTYCHREYVGETIASVFAQTFTDYELIVVNDGSPDDTSRVLVPLLDRIHYFEQTNQGQAAARNYGLTKARGQFVAFLDDDDLWPVDKLKWQVEYLTSHPHVDAVGGTCSLVGDTRSPRASDEGPRALSIHSLYRGGNFTSPGQTLIRRDALERIGGFDPGVWGADDLDLYMRLAATGTITLISRVSLVYRLHANNASKDYMRMILNVYRVLQKNLLLLPIEERNEAELAGNAWLYEYAGRASVVAAKAAFRLGKPAVGLRSLQALGPLFGGIVRSAKLRATFFKDLIPFRLRQRLMARPR